MSLSQQHAKSWVIFTVSFQPKLFLDNQLEKVKVSRDMQGKRAEYMGRQKILYITCFCMDMWSVRIFIFSAVTINKGKETLRLKSEQFSAITFAENNNQKQTW